MNMLGSRDVIRSSDGSHSAGPSRITIFVLFTGVRKTLDALRSAGRLARDLDAHIEIIVPEIVPYPLPLDEPPVLRSFWNHRYRTIVEQAGIDTSIHVCLCREPREALASVLTPGSIVVIGTRRPRWPTREYRFGRWLRTKGYHVIFAGARSGAPEVSWAYGTDHLTPRRC
jgi:hypothetical protein